MVEMIFTFLLEVSVLNAYILQKSSNTGGKEQDYLSSGFSGRACGYQQEISGWSTSSLWVPAGDLKVVDLELVGTSRRSQGGRPQACGYQQEISGWSISNF